MNKEDILQYVKDNQFGFCPECANHRGNEIEVDPENPDGEVATVSCANCGIGWVIDRPE